MFFCAPVNLQLNSFHHRTLANGANRYTAMPADALKVFESIRKEDDKIWSSVVPKAARTSGSQGAAPQITAMPLYVHGAVAAVVGAVAVAL